MYTYSIVRETYKTLATINNMNNNMNKEKANQLLKSMVSAFCHKKDSILQLIEGVKSLDTEDNGNVVITLNTGEKLELSIVVR